MGAYDLIVAAILVVLFAVAWAQFGATLILLTRVNALRQHLMQRIMEMAVTAAQSAAQTAIKELQPFPAPEQVSESGTAVPPEPEPAAPAEPAQVTSEPTPEAARTRWRMLRAKELSILPILRQHVPASLSGIPQPGIHYPTVDGRKYRLIYGDSGQLVSAEAEPDAT